jgi:hypothetical protein
MMTAPVYAQGGDMSNIKKSQRLKKHKAEWRIIEASSSGSVQGDRC